MREDAGYCIDCRWLESRADPSGTEYYCGLTQERLGPSLCLRACGEFELAQD